MGRLTREHDWAASTLGEPSAWPQGLRTALRLLLNTGHPIYIFWGEEGLCFYNDAYRPSLGVERHPRSLGRPAREVWGEIWPVIGPQIEQVMAGRGATWHENQLIPMTRNGVREDVYWTYSFGPIDDDRSASGVGGVLVVCHETTQQVEGARRLADSEARLNLALSAGRGIGTWDWDLLSNRVVSDARFARLYGVDPDRAKAGAPLAEFFAAMHHDDIDRVRDGIAATLERAVPFSEEYRLVGADGVVRWVLAEGRLERAADGTPLRFQGVSYEITDRKIAMERLRELNAELERKVIERALERGRTWQVSPELLGVINAEGRFETSNRAWEVTLGWSEPEVASQVFLDFIHPDDLARTEQAWADATERGLPALRFENRYRCKDGAYRWLSWVAVPEGGKIYCSARDVTVDKERAQALEAAEEALRQSQKMEAVGQLTGGIAHDFNNLLAAIGGSFEVIQRSVEQGRVDRIARFLEIGKSAVTRAASLTHRLLAFSRQQTLDPRPTDLDRLVAGMEELVNRSVGPGVRVEVVRCEGLWSTRVDPNQLENVLLNLCINARDAMPEGGRLTIETANLELDAGSAEKRDLAPGCYVTLCVTDNGTGMTAEVAAKAFDPFFTTKTIGAGTGLGLSMTYGFARQSGGQVRIHSQPGEGTTVRVYLPRDDSKPPEAGTACADIAPPTPAASTAGAVVLVVDDEEAVRLMVVDVLEQAGYTALQAADGRAGLQLLGSTPKVDLLVTDIGLPGMNGRQLADAARVVRPQLRVLFITGFAENAVMGDGGLEPGMSLLTKPFAMDDLARRVGQMLAT